MSDHYHLVLRADPISAQSWSLDEVIQRWLCLHKGPFLIQQYQKGEALDKVEMNVITKIVDDWRVRLSSISEFMQQLNQVIARQANIEENCTGRFWEGRFKSHTLLTDDTLLTAMAYVDLNPIRADMAQTPEKSDHTSIKERIKPAFDIEKALANNPDINKHHLNRFTIKPLGKFEQVIKITEQQGILFGYEDYLTLVDTTGRIQRTDKRGSILNHLLPILQRIKIELSDWLNNVTKFEALYYQQFSKAKIYKNTYFKFIFSTKY